MQGFIIRLQRVKDEDLIVSILTQQRLETLYRFYGARHGTINLGFLIDFEIERTLKTSIGRLYDVVHLGFPWLMERERLRTWQQFVTLFYTHLKESEESGSFYFELLQTAANIWQRQNPKRVAIESYAALLDFEGRLPDRHNCFFCDQPIETEKIGVIRAFQYAHTHCAPLQPIGKNGVDELLRNRSALFLSDREVDTLWHTLLEGL